MSHTPTPWGMVEVMNHPWAGKAIGLGPNPQTVRPLVWTQNAFTAELVVRAVNSHDVMLAALEDVLPDVSCHCHEAYALRGLHEPNSVCHLEADVRAAIAAAKGEPIACASCGAAPCRCSLVAAQDAEQRLAEMDLEIEGEAWSPRS